MKNNFEDETLDLVDDFCDLDNNKICDNCGKCLETDKEFNSIKITKIILEEKEG